MLSKRLLAVANLVNKDSIMADIGSDHGLLPCFLAKNKIVKKAYAIDNKEGPLKAAIENINKYQVKNLVFPVLADGLNDLNKEVNVIVIAGMGWLTISKILEQDLHIINNFKQVIIQSNTDVDLVRKWVMDNEYIIEHETIVFENGQYYFIISFNPQFTKKYDLQEWQISNFLLNKNDSLYFKYLKDELKKLKEYIKFKNDPFLFKKITIIENILKRK